MKSKRPATQQRIWSFLFIAISAATIAAASPAMGQTDPPPEDCTDVPPANPPPGTNCSWVKISVQENWEGEAVSSPSGPTVVVLYQDALDYQCYAGDVPCDEYPSLPIEIQTIESKMHRWQVGAGVSISAATKLALKLVVDAKATVEVTAEYENEQKHDYIVTIGPFQQAFGTKWTYLDTIEKWTASGTITEADYRVTWCNSCICGDVEYTYCGETTEYGTATGYEGRLRSLTCALDCTTRLVNCED